MSEKSMMIFAAEWQNVRSFRLLPISNDCPYNEVLYDPNTKILAIISKDHKPKPQMLPKLDIRGNLKHFTGKGENGESVPAHAQERVFLDVYYEYYMDEKDDILRFISHFAINPDHEGLSLLNDEIKTTVEKKPGKAKK